MAPNQNNMLLYENEDVEKVKTYEKKGELYWESQSTTPCPGRKVPLVCGKKKTCMFFIIPISLVVFFPGIPHRLSNKPDPLCQWFSCQRETRIAGTAQPDALVFLARHDALDGVQVGMC